MRLFCVFLLVAAIVFAGSCNPVSKEIFIAPDLVYVFQQDGSTGAFVESGTMPGIGPILGNAPGGDTKLGIAPLVVARGGLSMVFIIGADHNIHGFAASLDKASLGRLRPLTAGFPLHVPGTPQALVADGGFLFVATAEGDVLGYRLDVTDHNAPALLPGSPARAGVDPRSMALVTLGPFGASTLYVSNHGSANISAFNISVTTGELREAPASPSPAGAGPIALQAYGGRFLYAANELSNDISAYQIASTGALVPITGSFPTGSQPVALAIEQFLMPRPYVYVANAASNTLSVFKIDQATGTLSTLATVEVGNRPVAVEAFQQVMVASAGSKEVFAFNVNDDGSLTLINPVLFLDQTPVTVVGVQTPK